MRTALLAAAAATTTLLAGCERTADKPATRTTAAKGQVLPVTDNHAAMIDMPGMGEMMRSMQGKPLPRDAAMQRMHERHEGMERIGKAFKAAGRTLKSGSPDLVVVRSSSATIAQLAGKTPGWFPAGSGPNAGKTAAKPDIWRKPADFVAKNQAFHQAAAGFAAAARSGNMPAIQARFGELGKTCKSCHDPYRGEMRH